MKKLLCFTTSLIAAVCAFGFGGAAAFADAETDEASSAGYYPTTFVQTPEFKNLEDYAVGNEEYLFLQDNVMYKYGNKRVVTYENSSKPVNHLYFEDGEFYYETIYGNVYALKNFNAEENPEIEDFASTTKTDKITQGDLYYHFDDTVLYVLANHVDKPLNGFKNLKQYGSAVYAVKENVLYALDGTDTPPAVTVENFELTAEIKVGGAYEKLTSSVEQNPKFVTLTNGAYMTEVNLNKLADNTNFVTGDTVTVNAAETSSALLIYSVKHGDEGIAIIAVKDKCYLIHPDNYKENVVDPFTKPEFEKGTITVDCPVYSTPYESSGTRVDGLASGAHVAILQELRKASRGELGNDFYYIQYSDEEGNEKTGYIRFGLLSTYDFKEDPPTPTEDPDATTEDLVKPVVLILIVLLLIAIAAGYLICIGTSGKRKQSHEVSATDAAKHNKQ